MITLKIQTNVPNPARTRAQRRRIRREHHASTAETPITIITYDKTGNEKVLAVYGPSKSIK